MLDKLEAIQQRFNDVSEQLTQPDAMSDMKRFKALNKEYKDLGKIVAEYKAYQNVLANIDGAKEVIATEKDEDFRQMAKDELETLYPEQERLEAVIKDLLLPKDPNDSKDVIMEIRAGAGGDEAAIFAGDLQRMYMRWGERHGFKVEVMDVADGEEAGIKGATLLIKGHNAYGWLKTESGVHRLVRISPFDSNARRHTSFASVWVYPVVDDRINIEVKESDCRIDTFRSSGAGGQHVNTTDSAVRITHIPSGIVVACQQERSQHKNRATAWNMLRARLYEQELKKREEKANAEAASKTDIGWGHQIRSYVLQPYQLVKDLRTGTQSTSPGDVLDGDIDPFVEAALAQRVYGGGEEVEDID